MEMRVGARSAAWIWMATWSLVVGSACDMAPGGGGCDNLVSGDFECSIGARTYLVHVPDSYTGQTAVPLVVDAHGFTSNAGQQRGLSGWLAKSDQEGFIVAYPQGVNDAFNAQGACCDFANVQDDVGFFRNIVSDVSSAANIDAGRVFATGLSNGGSMAHTVACEASDVFVAVAPVAFQLSGGNDTVAGTVAACNPPVPVAVIHFHGTADTVTPYDEGVLDALGALESLDAWRQIQSCNPVNVDTRFTSNTVCERHSGCTGGAFVSLCTVQGGPHVLYASVAGSGMTIPDVAYPMLLEFAATDPR